MYSVQSDKMYRVKRTASILVRDDARLGCRYGSSSWSDSSSGSIIEKKGDYETRAHIKIIKIGYDRLPIRVLTKIYGNTYGKKN